MNLKSIFRLQLLILCLIGIPTFLLAQETIKIDDSGNVVSPLGIEEYTLSNGLKVYLNPDPSQTNVFGAVVIKGGSKRDPKDATGIAHYLEHMMFKGTDQIGTIDFESEKLYLDSITIMYDILGKTTDEIERSDIQQTINRLSISAGKYAIPNEMDRILKGIGSTGINAFTSHENIVYFNMFPGHHIEKWLEIYSHRFINPIFRLFQSELETVYEEKNMYMDNSFFNLFEQYLEAFYLKSPYGQQSVLGSVEHLKNPSLSKMYDYFNTYYVANNMALILSGNFDIDFARHLVAEKFSAWRSGDIEELKDFTEEPFSGRELKKVRLTPIKMGLLGYRTVPKGHTDSPVFEVISELLSNSASTGLLDKLYTDNKILGAGLFHQQYEENGGAIVLFVPKIVGQSLRRAERLVLAEIQKIVEGEFSEEDLKTAKMNLRKQNMQSLEHPMQRGMAIIEAFNMNMSWNDYLTYTNSIQNVSRDDVVRVAKDYFGKDYLAFHSRMGFPKKHKLEKPPYDPVTPQSADASSEYGRNIESMPSMDSEPRFIDFDTDLTFYDFVNGNSVYHTFNPVNELFNLTIRFGVGSEVLPELEAAQTILDMAHPADMTYDEFKDRLNKLGTSMYISVSESYTSINMSGFDEYLSESLELAGRFINNPTVDKKHLKKIRQAHKANLKVEKKEPSAKASALFQYALYKDESSYLKRYSGKELKRLNADSLMAASLRAFQYQAEIIYSGTWDFKRLFNDLDVLRMPATPLESNSPVEKQRETYTANTIYLLNDPKAVQSQIHIFIEGAETIPEESPYAQAFNQYFGQGMSSLMFQEIREFRSLAYSASATYRMPFYRMSPGYLSGFMSTQADKTIDALHALRFLIDSMPQKEERMENLRMSLLETSANSKPGFRAMGSSVSHMRKRGFNDDIRKKHHDVFNDLNFLHIIDFYSRHIANRPVVITIVTDVKRFDVSALEAFGNVVIIDDKKIFTK